MRKDTGLNRHEILAAKSRDLFRAISCNDHASVALLLQEFPQLRSAAISSEGASALHVVASSPLADVGMAQIVLGRDVAAVHFDAFQNTPFAVACLCGRVDLAHFFAEQNYATYFRDSLGNSPLHYAYFWGDDFLVEKLVSTGVDQALKNQAGYTPFEVGQNYHPKLARTLYDGTVTSKHKQPKKKLFKESVKLAAVVETPLAQPADVGIVEIEKNTKAPVQEETPTSVYSQKMTGLMKVSKAAKPNVTDEEKQESRERNRMKNAEDEKREFDEAEINQRKAAADLAEFQNRQRERVELARLEEERRIADEQRKDLELAELAKQALEENQDDPDFDPEWEASSVKDLNYVAKTLGAQITFSESSKSLDKKDDLGDSLIHHAIAMVANRENSAEVVMSLVKNLVKNGLDVNLRGSGNMTPLARVCSYEGDHVELAEFLLKKGARAEDETGIFIEIEIRYIQRAVFRRSPASSIDEPVYCRIRWMKCGIWR